MINSASDYRDVVLRVFAEELERLGGPGDYAPDIEVPPTPPVVQIGIVQDMCDLACRHCLLPNMRKAGTISPRIMEMGLYRKIVDQVAQMDQECGSSTAVRFLGSGEVLLDPRLPERIEYAKTRLRGPVGLITNGQRLGACIESGKSLGEALLHAGIDLIDVSIDACSEETYQTLRGDKRHSYARLRSITEDLVKARDSGAYRASIIGSFLIQPENCHEADEFRSVWSRILDRVIFRKYHSYRGNIDAKPHADAPLNSCAAPLGRLNIPASGVVNACYLDWKSEFPVGDLNDDRANVLDIWRNGPLRSFQQAHARGKLPAFCANCDGIHAAHRGPLAYDNLLRHESPNKRRLPILDNGAHPSAKEGPDQKGDDRG